MTPAHAPHIPSPVLTRRHLVAGVAAVGAVSLALPGVALARGGEGGVPLFGFILLPWERRRA